MKHIKKRFYLTKTEKELKKDKNMVQFGLETLPLPANPNTVKLKSKNAQIFLISENGEGYGCFLCKIDGKERALPVPDPTLVYFNSAQRYFSLMKKTRKKLVDKLDTSKPLTETGINEIYDFYEITSGFVIFLFTAIESFINQRIPENYQYVYKGAKKTEIYSQTQIYQTIDFMTKFKTILPDATNNRSFKTGTPTYTHIVNLKKFRDEIIHTKPQKEGKNIEIDYKELLKRAINFKYKDSLFAVAKFMNHYKSGYIVECDCEQDF